MDLEAPDVARAAEPGQFLQVRPDWGRDPLLPRPFSVHRRLAGPGGEPRGVSILYRIVGRGTRLLTAVGRGDEVRILGPLGRAFDLSGLEGRCALVAGGMGAAPLLFLAEAAAARHEGAAPNAEVILGAPRADALVAEEEFRRTGLEVSVATDDGSMGHHGTVVDLLANRLKGPRPPGRIFAVGPEPMYRSLREALNGRDVPCQISVERRMACGVGACRSCVVAWTGDGGRKTYVDVCRRGPVFDLKDVVFDDEMGKQGG
jgi:dihydroorotate dehydrogenase electron transfer subunit